MPKKIKEIEYVLSDEDFLDQYITSSYEEAKEMFENEPSWVYFEKWINVWIKEGDIESLDRTIEKIEERTK